MSSTYCFSVHALTSPSVLPRVLDVFSLYGQVPSVCHSTLCGEQDEELVVDVQMTRMDDDVARLVAKRLGRIVEVTGVLYSRKQGVMAAA